MKSLPKTHFERARRVKQRGVVLFFTLIALLVMSLAAVALIRSVDTSTMIAGNMAFKQSTTTAADAGLENARNWIGTTYATNSGKNVYSDATNTFNLTDATRGYYSNAGSVNLFADATWNAITNIPEIIDASNNGITVRYIIERMCLTANAVPFKLENPATTPPQTACLFTAPAEDGSGTQIKLPNDVCPLSNPGCPAAGQSPQYRVTARATGQRFAVSYIQAFVN
jgi:Tfp pilus assembly protein PilX